MIIKMCREIFFFLLFVILPISGCVQDETEHDGSGEWIPPELRPSAINLSKEQAKEVVEVEIINDVGEKYFLEHYKYLKIEPLVQNQETIGYRVYYEYNGLDEKLLPKEMFIYVGAAGPDHDIFFDKYKILNSPIEITSKNLTYLKSLCLEAFGGASITIGSWSHGYYIDTVADSIVLELKGSLETPIKKENLMVPYDVISCTFDVTDNNILSHEYGTQIIPVT